MHCMRPNGYAPWVTASSVRRVGQAVTALSAVIIAYATLTAAAGGVATEADELVHFLLFLPMGFGGALWMANLPVARQRRARALVLLLILVFAALTEVGQLFVEGRNASTTDFVADAAGAGIGAILGGLVAERARREE